MSPHEVIKNSIEKFHQKWNECNCEQGFDIGQCHNASSDTGQQYAEHDIADYLKSSQLSLLLSVKEMVETKKKDTSFWEKDLTPEEKLLKAIYSKEEYLAKEYCDGYNQALSDLQSFLDTEINKIKEL